MPRLVPDQSAPAAGRGELNARAEPPPKERLENYLERVVKYVPVEIVAAFIAIRGWMPPLGSPNAPPPWAEIGLYVALIAMTWAYLYYWGGDVPRKKLQATLGAASFIFWSYGIGGPFFFKAVEKYLDAPVEYQGLGAAVVVVWSLAIGLVQPKS